MGGKSWNVGSGALAHAARRRGAGIRRGIGSAVGGQQYCHRTAHDWQRRTAGCGAACLHPLLPGADSDTLLTSPETFADLREFELRDIRSSTTVRATTLVERTSRFDMFQFQ